VALGGLRISLCLVPSSWESCCVRSCIGRQMIQKSRGKDEGGRLEN
jgi:hypothetical protein